MSTWLLDTNILLAATIAPERLPADAAGLLRDPGNAVLFSAASIWEIPVNWALNRESLAFLPEDIHRLALDTRFTELPVLAADCHAVARLPWHHCDPFDRLLVAQAQTLPARLLTSDAALPAYSNLVSLIVVR